MKAFNQNYFEFLLGTDSYAVIAVAFCLSLVAGALGFSLAVFLLKIK